MSPTIRWASSLDDAKDVCGHDVRYRVRRAWACIHLTLELVFMFRQSVFSLSIDDQTQQIILRTSNKK
jgi:hypothetical protein